RAQALQRAQRGCARRPDPQRRLVAHGVEADARAGLRPPPVATPRQAQPDVCPHDGGNLALVRNRAPAGARRTGWVARRAGARGVDDPAARGGSVAGHGAGGVDELGGRLAGGGQPVDAAGPPNKPPPTSSPLLPRRLPAKTQAWTASSESP